MAYGNRCTYFGTLCAPASPPFTWDTVISVCLVCVLRVYKCDLHVFSTDSPSSQVISLLFDAHGFGRLAAKIIFVAGHKVTTDPVCVPFSMGRNLICIHSKKHMKGLSAEEAASRQSDNLRSVQAMSVLLAEGGHVFWVAPSGGRDRPNDADIFQVSEVLMGR